MSDQQVGNTGPSNAPSPNWYKNPNGTLQWWDGKNWGPLAPSEQFEERQPGTYMVNNEFRWWDGSEWWSRSEVADLLLARSPRLQKAGWQKHPNGSVLWNDGNRWLSDFEITDLLIRGKQGFTHPGAFTHSGEQKSTGVAYLFLLLLGNFGAHRFYLGSPGIACIFIATWTIMIFMFIFTESSSPNILFIIVAMFYLVLYIADLCTLPSQVRNYNQQQSRLL